MSVEAFKKSHDKLAFILSPEFDKDLYSNLLKTGNLSLKERKQIAKELVNSSNKNTFYQLIRKLTNFCFETKGPEFIRGGSTDFLADILQALVEKTDGKHFVAECEKALKLEGNSGTCAFPVRYQRSETLNYVLTIIYDIAKRFAEKNNNDNYTNNLAQNLANKVFFPLLINQGSPEEGAALVTPFKVWAGSKENAVEVQEYFQPNDNKKSISDAIDSIEQLILNEKWQLGGFGLFQGGVSINFEHTKLRVPHRVAAIADLITKYKQNEINLYSLYDEIRVKAQEGLDDPRMGQHRNTRVFYEKVVNNFYRDVNASSDTSNLGISG